MTEIALSTKVGPSKSGKRIEYLDAIRGVASLMVVVQHSVELWVPRFLRWSLDYVNFGRVGIVAFFLVSGYVVGLTLTSQSAQTFSVRRFWRLYPAYWAATIVYVAASVGTGSFKLDEYSIFVLILNVAMLQGFLGLVSVLGVAWTLGLEIVFYLQSVAMKLVSHLEKGVWLGFIWLVLFAVQVAANEFMGVNFQLPVPLMLFTASFGFAWYLWDTKKCKAVFAYLAAALTAVPLLGGLLVAAKVDQEGWSSIGFNASYLLGVALFAIAYSLRSRQSAPALIWLGSISYGLYLIHASILVTLQVFDLPAPVLVSAAVLASILAGWAMHMVLERPAIGFGRKITKTW